MPPSTSDIQGAAMQLHHSNQTAEGSTGQEAHYSPPTREVMQVYRP